MKKGQSQILVTIFFIILILLLVAGMIFYLISKNKDNLDQANITQQEELIENSNVTNNLASVNQIISNETNNETNSEVPIKNGEETEEINLNINSQEQNAVTKCGNSITEAGEACDGTDVNGYTCASVAAGFKSGTLRCKAGCREYDVSNCSAGKIWNAASCSQVDVQSAINNASDGDIVVVPEGNCVWTTLISGKHSVTLNKSILLKGAGIGKTNITDGTGSLYGEQVIWVETNKTFRITGISFLGVPDVYNPDVHGIIKIIGHSNAWRIDHCEFYGFNTGNGIYTENINYGVVDNCNFRTIRGSGTNNFKGFQLTSKEPGEILKGDTSWSSPLSLGTRNAVYIDNNTFNYAFDYPMLDGDEGSRFVIRYNFINNSRIVTHGHDGDYQHRSVLSYEIYENEFVSNLVPNTFSSTFFRGGTGVLFNNTFAGNYNIAITGVNYCSCLNHPTCSAWPQCTEYPCPDQIGRAPDADQNGIQDLEPLYQWNNNFIGPYAQFYVHALCTNISDHIQVNRDFYNNVSKPNYVPYVYPHPLSLI